MDRTTLRAACRALPLFPLPGTVLLPANLLPLHVFEPRYRELVRDCLGGGGPLAVPEVQLAPGEGMGLSPPFLPYAGVGVIAAHQQRSDGRFDIVLEPVGRVRIDEELSGTGHLYRVGRAELLEDTPVSAAALARVGERVRGLVASVLGRVGAPAESMLRALLTLPPERVPDAMAGLAFGDTAARQAFLREDAPLARAELVEAAVLERVAEAGGPVAEA